MYATVVELKAMLGIAPGNTDDDAILGHLLQEAEAVIDRHFSARFEATAGTRRYTHDMAFPYRNVLALDAPLLDVTTITDADGNTIATSDYELWPLNATPKWYIRFRNGSSIVYPITVHGTWGYTQTPPADVKGATLALAAYYYRRRDAQVFHTVYSPEEGALRVPPGIPEDVRYKLDLLQVQYHLA